MYFEKILLDLKRQQKELIKHTECSAVLVEIYKSWIAKKTETFDLLALLMKCL